MQEMQPQEQGEKTHPGSRVTNRRGRESSEGAGEGVEQQAEGLYLGASVCSVTRRRRSSAAKVAGRGKGPEEPELFAE